jgi:hypothetical protein
LNREINKVNLLIHSHYSEILKRTGKVTAPEVKNAFQGIASVQKTLLVLFGEIMREFYSRVGIDRAKASYLQYVNTHKYLQRFLKEKYNIGDIPLTQLDLTFIENFDFYLRIERKMKPASVNGIIIHLLSAAKVSGNKNCNLIPQKDLFPLTGYIRGDCSPVGMKKKFPAYIHETCLRFDCIFVSADQRGLQMKIRPTDLIAVVKAETADLV